MIMHIDIRKNITGRMFDLTRVFSLISVCAIRAMKYVSISITFIHDEAQKRKKEQINQARKRQKLLQAEQPKAIHCAA